MREGRWTSSVSVNSGMQIFEMQNFGCRTRGAEEIYLLDVANELTLAGSGNNDGIAAGLLSYDRHCSKQSIWKTKLLSVCIQLVRAAILGSLTASSTSVGGCCW